MSPRKKEPVGFRILAENISYTGTDGEEHNVAKGDTVTDLPEETAARWLSDRQIEEA